MIDLFASDTLEEKPCPLAERLRPTILTDVIGQDHLVGGNGILHRLLKASRLPSLIFWGPPGTGKTSLAQVLARQKDYEFYQLSAVFSGVADLKAIFEKARKTPKSVLLFIDEIHRFNKAQQDALLGPMESGLITLVGATTENPSFSLNSALLSRARVLTLNRLEIADLEKVLVRCESLQGKSLPVTEEARSFLLTLADGDARMLINLIETIIESEGVLSQESLVSLLQKRAPAYDKNEDAHYNLISAFIKSMRGSDPDAALYWFARMLEGGEDPLFLARRMIRFAAEDIGLADPHALPFSIASMQSYERLGSPEGELSLAGCAVYLATAPKSNAIYTALGSVRKFVKDHESLMPPLHILNAPTKLMKKEGYGAGYHYDHDAPDAFSGQNYFPEGMNRQRFYYPVERGFEREIVKRLDYWNKLRTQRQTQES